MTCVFFLGYTTSWVIDNVQLIKYDRFFATGSNAVQGGFRSADNLLIAFDDSRWGPSKWLEATVTWGHGRLTLLAKNAKLI